MGSKDTLLDWRDPGLMKAAGRSNERREDLGAWAKAGGKVRLGEE